MVERINGFRWTFLTVRNTLYVRLILELFFSGKGWLQGWVGEDCWYEFLSFRPFSMTTSRSSHFQDVSTSTPWTLIAKRFPVRYCYRHDAVNIIVSSRVNRSTSANATGHLRSASIQPRPAAAANWSENIELHRTAAGKHHVSVSRARDNKTSAWISSNIISRRIKPINHVRGGIPVYF